MARKIVCPICKEKIFLKLYNHKYLYPWNNDSYIGKNVHKGCIKTAIEEGFYKEPEFVKSRYKFDAVYDEDTW